MKTFATDCKDKLPLFISTLHGHTRAKTLKKHFQYVNLFNIFAYPREKRTAITDPAFFPFPLPSKSCSDR
jgi:hypothetical protein